MSRYLLVTTKRCCKCPWIKRDLLKAWIDFKTINEDDEELFAQTVAKYDLREAPSLIDLVEDRVVNIDSILQ